MTTPLESLVRYRYGQPDPKPAPTPTECLDTALKRCVTGGGALRRDKDGNVVSGTSFGVLKFWELPTIPTLAAGMVRRAMPGTPEYRVAAIDHILATQLPNGGWGVPVDEWGGGEVGVLYNGHASRAVEALCWAMEDHKPLTTNLRKLDDIETAIARACNHLVECMTPWVPRPENSVDPSQKVERWGDMWGPTEVDPSRIVLWEGGNPFPTWTHRVWALPGDDHTSTDNATALHLASLVLPDHPDAERWRAAVRRFVESGAYLIARHGGLPCAIDGAGSMVCPKGNTPNSLHVPATADWAWLAERVVLLVDIRESFRVICAIDKAIDLIRACRVPHLPNHVHRRATPTTYGHEPRPCWADAERPMYVTTDPFRALPGSAPSHENPEHGCAGLKLWALGIEEPHQ